MSTPARPILASNLLSDLETHGDNSEHHVPGHRGENKHETWNLKGELEDGILSTASGSILSCGRVLGISGVSSAHRGWRLEDERELQTCIYDLSLHILASTLTNGRRLRKVYVVQYFDCRQLSSENLVSVIQSRLPDLPVEDIDALVDNVQIYRVFDFDEVLEAVDQVSDILYQPQRDNGQRLGNQETQSRGRILEPTLLLLEGIDRSLEDIIRASNPVAAHSRLVPLLRTLTVLSRTYASNLGVVVVNSGPLPSRPVSFRSPLPHRGDARNEDEGAEESQDVPKQLSSLPYTTAAAHDFDYDPFIPAQSIFADIEAFASSSSHEPTAGASSLNSYTSLLARSLDQGFDTHLLVSKIENEVVVEVAKDRVGGSLGRWCVL